MKLACKYQNFSRNERGFSLIEIIVVVAIIGVMVAMLGVQLSRDTDRLARLEAKRFHAIVNEVRDESVIAGEAFVLLVDHTANEYEFQAVRTNRQLQTDDGLLRKRTLEEGVQLNWDVFEQFDSEDQLTKKVLISPLGEITPFEAWFTGDENKYYVFVNNQNQLEQRVQ